MLATHPQDAGLSGRRLAAAGHAAQHDGDKLVSDVEMSVKYSSASWANERANSARQEMISFMLTRS